MNYWILVIFISSVLVACNLLLAPVLFIIRFIAGHGKTLEPSSVRSISVIVPAYNEEKSIGEKIDTLCRALERIDVDVEVLIGSDGSTDRTVEIISARLLEMNASNWRIVEFENEGKCKTLNKLVSLARGEIIISTDADIPLPQNAIELVVSSFKSNKMLGCLSCIPYFEGLNIGSQKSYWSIEDQIRRSESKLGKLIVVTGMLYAYRRELFEEIPKGVMADDLWIPLNVLLKGYDSIQVEELLVPYEKTDEKVEIQRRKRVIIGGMDVVMRLWPRLVRSPALFLLIFFHKVNRWAVPLWLFLFVGATVVFWHWFIIVYAFLTAVLFFYLGSNRFFALAYSILTPVLSLLEFMSKSDFARWEHTRKHEGI